MNNKIKSIAIVTCVTDYKLYDQLKKSIPCRRNIRIYSIDNTSKNVPIASAYNSILTREKAEIFVLVHQDVIFPDRWLEALNDQIRQVEKIDENWGVLGIMGVRKCGRFAGNIIDPHTNTRIGSLPAPVMTLDEVCLVIRPASGLLFDESLGGYHLYGADICLQAQHRGYRCYSIDAPLIHLSGGNVDSSFWEISEKFKKKWKNNKSIPGVVETTCGVFVLSSSPTAWFLELAVLTRRKIVRRLQGRHRRSIETGADILPHSS